MADSEPKLREVFSKALECQTAQDQASYLDRTCQGDVELRARVEELLQAHRAAGSFLQEPSSGRTACVDEPSAAERPGTVIGSYKLLQKIGEGGMGTVFMAEQTYPVQRKVALKVIKPGMESRPVIARFEVERQALALMDHVNIARVLDAGATESGRPYFVMELIHGVPITQYCDDNHLTPRERLELFVPVCQAIQHAHQKGIIHRDIKPSNVMVTLYDGQPVPKVIDFGVAKAIEQRLTERTLFTQYGVMVGTLEYMSPEQAEMSGLGVDTRSDIYSLGVLLYELLTGSTPLSPKRIREAAYGEVLHMIKQEEPPKPSTRLSDSGEALASISAQRHTEPTKLAKLMRGELDWIVMKCLEKDRARRYETAHGFAADLRRYLDDETVQACPPSVSYRLGKFARRHKVGLAVAGAAASLLVTAVVALLVANYHIARQRNLAQREHERAEANLVKARAAVDDYLTTVSENTLLKSPLPGLQPLRKELLQSALRYYQDFVRVNQEDRALRFELAAATFRVGVITTEIESPAKGLKSLVEARAMFQELADADPSRTDYRRELGRCIVRIGYTLTSLSNNQEVVTAFKQGIATLEAILPDRPADDLLRSDLAFGQHYLSKKQVEMGLVEEGSRHSRRAIELRRELADRNPSEPRYRSDLAQSVNNLSYAQYQAGQLDDALENAKIAETTQRLLVREQPWNTSMRRSLSLSIRARGAILASKGRMQQSLSCLQESSAIMEKLVSENPLDIDLRRVTARGYSEYGQTLIDHDQPELAKQVLARAQEHAEIVHGENPKDVDNLSVLSSIHRTRGKILDKQGKSAEAMQEVLKALTIDEGIASQAALFRYDLACSLAQCSGIAGRRGAHAEADEYAARAIGELRKAWDQGWKNSKLIATDADLDSVRSRPDFKAFMQSVRGKGDKPSH